MFHISTQLVLGLVSLTFSFAAFASEPIGVPGVDQSSIAKVGETLYSVSDRQTLEELVPASWRLADSISDSVGVSDFDFSVGTRLTDQGGGKFCVEAAPHKCLHDDDADGTFDRISARPGLIKFKQELNRVIRYEKSEAKLETRSVGETYRRELVYLGVSSNTLRVQYREFNDDLIRPAFSQELTYPVLSGSTAIVYQSLQIKVLKILPTEIHYVVKSGGL